MSTLAADALVVIGLVVITIGVYGVARMPDAYTQLHAASKAAFLGVAAMLVAAALSGDLAIVARSLLIIGLLVLTTPVAAHAIGEAAYARHEPMRTQGAIDEHAHRCDALGGAEAGGLVRAATDERRPADPAELRGR